MIKGRKLYSFAPEIVRKSEHTSPSIFILRQLFLGNYVAV